MAGYPLGKGTRYGRPGIKKEHPRNRSTLCQVSTSLRGKANRLGASLSGKGEDAKDVGSEQDPEHGWGFSFVGPLRELLEGNV
jgi:hypothetical protein